MVREIDYHSTIKQKLLTFNPFLKIYINNEFRNVSKSHQKKPDLLIFLNQPFDINGKQIKVIGVEVKLATKFGDITKAVFDQSQGTYIHETYSTKDWEGKVDLMIITTKPALENGFLYDKHFVEEGEKYCEGINFTIERFCWKTNIGVLLMKNGFPQISLNNRRYDLHGVYSIISNYSE